MASSASEPCAIVPVDTTVAPHAALAPVAGEAALVWVVRSLLGPGRVPAARVVVATIAMTVADVRSALEAAGLADVAVVASAEPGSRGQCLAAGLEHLGREVDSPRHVLVHDHRWPLTSTAVTDRVLGALEAGHPVVVPVLPITDTVKQVDDGGSVTATVDRHWLRTVQYPRGYRADTLARLIDDGDDLGHGVATVAGDPDAVAADLPADAALIGAIIEGRRPR
ncbi:2-C-methyl-D-erythritol 4-phosphate cytidylyltransferase [Mycolicibacterium sp. YH-1]|uniref:IspD/TarI family cytidylyltransferase n=1 Tax=Mycolicibacterium sp. YH-1 TaxID=2908837 RepID=UPI001F4BE568|nr:2-C-methyl-D-erythritol 4-phosphate cytidylyltransferase [Mycolicibacterium sp. YH-1]UNB54768.1 2-C-methyl-D-erythritol 4-phosphate cytidylyltransferase [Mycolicibacterium sp. YH-1]